MMSLMNLPKRGGGGWSGGGAPPSKRGRFDAGQSASGGTWSKPMGFYDQAANDDDYVAKDNYSGSYAYDDKGWDQPTLTGSGYWGQQGMNTRGRRGAATAPPQQHGDTRQPMSTSFGNTQAGNDYYPDSLSEQALHQQQNPSRGRGRGLGPQAPQHTSYFEYNHGSDNPYDDQPDDYGSGYQSGVAQKRKFENPYTREGDNYEPLSLTGTFSSYNSSGSGLSNIRDGGTTNRGYGAMGGQGGSSGFGSSGYISSEEPYYEQSLDRGGYDTGYQQIGRGQGTGGRGGMLGRGLAGRNRGIQSSSFSDDSTWGGSPPGGMKRGGGRGDSGQGMFGGGNTGYGSYGGDSYSGGQSSFGREDSGGTFGSNLSGGSFGGNSRGYGQRGAVRARGSPRGRGRGQAAPLMGNRGSRGGARWSSVGITPRPGAPGNTLSLPQRFKNLCMLVKRSPRIALASSALESFLADESVCLAPAYVFKGERREETQPFSFNCKVYINNVYIANGMATNKKDSKNRACDAALRVLAQKPALTILNEHDKVNVSALGKQDADIVECALKTSESNIGNVLSKGSGGDDKSITDFYILEPEQVDESTGMNSTCILRQSADFSHLLLKYEFTASPKGFVCSVNIEGKTLARATAAQQNLAKNSASHIALQNLRKNNWTIQIIKQEKPKAATELLTDELGQVKSAEDRPDFIAKLKDHLSQYFSALEDHTRWLALSSELNREERDCVYTVSKELGLRVETKRVDGGRGPVGESDGVFLVVSKKMTCQDLFDYIWEKGGETWRYKLRPPSQFKVPSGKSV